MDPAGCADPLATSWEPWPARSRANVVFLPGERGAAERIVRRLFQRPLEGWEYAGLAGAPDDAQVEVGALRGRLYIEMGDPVAATYRGHYYVCLAAPHLVVINDGFHIPLRTLHAPRSWVAHPSSASGGRRGTGRAIASKWLPVGAAKRTVIIPGRDSASRVPCRRGCGACCRSVWAVPRRCWI